MAENTVDSTYSSSFESSRFQNATEVIPTDAYSHQAAQLEFTPYDFGPGALLLGSMDAQSLISQDTLPHSSQGQVAQSWATFDHDLEEPYYLIKEGGAPNTEKIEEYQRLSEYKFDMNFAEGERRKSPPQTYSIDLNMLLVTPSDGSKKSKNFIFWTAKEVKGGRVRILILRKDKMEKHKPVELCPKHREKWNETRHYILSANNSPSIQYYNQGEHPVLVVPLEQSYEETNAKTGDDGYAYPREFFFPCNASDLDQESFSLVAALEVPSQSNCGMYHCVGVTTVDVRVCGSPGRDKDRREGKLPSSPATMKEGASRKRSTRDSTDTDASGGPPIPKQKKVPVKRSANEAANPLTDEATTGLFTGSCPSSSAVYAAPVPTVGVTCEEDPTSTVVPVAMEMGVCSTNSTSNADFNGQLRQLWAHINAAQQILGTLMQQVPHTREVQAAETTSGGDSHSHA